MKLIEQLNRGLFWLAAVATIAMALLGLTIVVLRYGFDTGWIAGQESVIYLHAFVLLTAAAATLADDAHVRVDIFYSAWGGRGRALVNLLGSVLLLLPFAGFLAWVSWDYVAAAWQRQERSADAGGLAYVYLLKSLMLLFAVQIFLQGLIQAVRAGRKLRSPD